MYHGKVIYNPSGKAGEYSYWAANFYVGCSNGCTYCYCKKGILAGVMGQDKPQLKKCFKNVDFAMGFFEKELKENLTELKKHGLFFSFTTDPMLQETNELTLWAIEKCYFNYVPSKILTKCTDWVDDFLKKGYYKGAKEISIGFTLTGHDSLEPGAATNAERIKAMKKLHDAGFKTWASIEPIIDLQSSFRMITDTHGFCDFYKIGLQSGKKYNIIELHDFMDGVVKHTAWLETPVYFKDSLLKQAGITRESLPSNCVNRDFNL